MIFTGFWTIPLPNDAIQEYLITEFSVLKFVDYCALLLQDGISPYLNTQTNFTPFTLHFLGHLVAILRRYFKPLKIQSQNDTSKMQYIFKNEISQHQDET